MTTKEFQDTLAEVTRNPQGSVKLSSVVNTLADKLDNLTQKGSELGLSGDDLRNARRHLINEAETRWMQVQYATVDLAFAERRRAIVIGRQPGDPDSVEYKRHGVDAGQYEVNASVPVFPQVWTTYGTLANYFSPTGPSGRLDYIENLPQMCATRFGGVYYCRLNLTASVKFPAGIDHKLLSRIRRCLSCLQIFYAALFDRGLVPYPGGKEHGEPRVGVLWCPIETDWSFMGTPPRPKGDPVVMVRHDTGSIYVVGYYDVPNETPIDHLVREFSSGPLEKPSRKR